MINERGVYIRREESIEVLINAEQDDGSGGIVPTPAGFNGSIYRRSTTYLANKNSTAASSYPYTIENLTKGTEYITETDYQTYSARVTFFGKQYYLKHDVVGNEIINTYICIVYNGAEHCMKGGDGGASFAANTSVIEDYQSFHNLTTCTFYSNASYCNGGIFNYVGSSSDGNMGISGSASDGCSVRADGSSYCGN